MARELLLEGQNVYPKILLNSGFIFSFPVIESALRHMLCSEEKL
jgi:NAD dependent epimerase/dehydratase family enzyme